VTILYSKSTTVLPQNKNAFYSYTFLKVRLIFLFFCAMFPCMTIGQTIEVPANRRVFFEVPPQVPVGAVARLEFIWSPQQAAPNTLDIALEKIWELCKDSSVSVDSFRAMRSQDKDLEELKHRRFFSETEYDN
jgi:hypothetical protein